jgi:hypothetical protein
MEIDLNVNTLVVEPYQLGINEFTITAENSAKVVVKQTFKVEVYEPCLAKIIKFDLSPLSVLEEDSKVTMSWQVEGASRIEVTYTGDGKAYQLDPSGTTEIPISAKTTFTIKVWDINSKTATKSVTVNYKKKPVEDTNTPSVIPNDPPPAASGATTGSSAGTGTTTGR